MRLPVVPYEGNPPAGGTVSEHTIMRRERGVILRWRAICRSRAAIKDNFVSGAYVSVCYAGGDGAVGFRILALVIGEVDGWATRVRGWTTLRPGGWRSSLA